MCFCCKILHFFFYLPIKPLQQFEWYGAPQGYHIKYRPVGCECSFSEAFVYDITANSHQLVDLQEYTLYEVTMVAVNDIGESAFAPVAVERTRESGKLIYMHYVIYSIPCLVFIPRVEGSSHTDLERVV